VHYVAEAYKHAKPIAATPTGPTCCAKPRSTRKTNSDEAKGIFVGTPAKIGAAFRRDCAPPPDA
jgi:hypothetical protein